MNQQPNMDNKLKQLENQSIPDMSRQDEHWQQMKNLLQPAVVPAPKTGSFMKLLYWLAAACVTGIIIYMVIRTAGKKNESTVIVNTIQQDPQPTAVSNIKDTSPVITGISGKDTLKFHYQPKSKRTGTSIQLKARTHTGKDTILEAVPVNEPPVATTVSANTPGPKATLAAFFAQLEKPTQEFLIDNRKDTIIWGNEGTALLIPANAFGTREKVKITLREFYSYKDIITHKLNTTSDGEQLITGGMLHLGASINGKPVNVNPSKSIRWFLPDTSANMEDMQLFIPSNNSSGLLYPKELNPDTLDVAYNNNSINWRASASSFNRNYITMSIRAVDLRDLPYRTTAKKKYKGYFFINTNSEYSKEELRKLLLDKYTQYDKVIIGGKRKKKEMSPFITYEDRDINYSIGDTVWFHPFEIRSNKLTPLDTITYTGGSSIASTPNLNNQLKKVAAKYSVNIDKLGWINCDKFYRSNQQKVQYVVNLGDTASNYHTFITFDRIKSMMAGYIAGNKVIFSNVPAGEKVKVISVGVRNGKTVSAMAAVELSNSTLNGLKFEETTATSFREQAASLDE